MHGVRKGLKAKMKPQKFHKTNEVEKWSSFELEGVVYEMDHLDAFHFDYIQPAQKDKAERTYKFKVTFSCHCFTCGGQKLSDEDRERLKYEAPREVRYFHHERHELSRQLPEMVRGLHQVFHTKHETFFTTKLVNETGIEETYEVFFVAYKEQKKLRIHVQSAYIPRDRELATGDKIRFSVIAHNTLMGKPIKAPQKKKGSRR